MLVETVLGAQAGVTWEECLERECLGVLGGGGCLGGAQGVLRERLGKCLRVLGGVERIRGECLGGMLAVSKF